MPAGMLATQSTRSAFRRRPVEFLIRQTAAFVRKGYYYSISGGTVAPRNFFNPRPH